jgi:hypothetical protein
MPDVDPDGATADGRGLNLEPWYPLLEGICLGLATGAVVIIVVIVLGT